MTELDYADKVMMQAAVLGMKVLYLVVDKDAFEQLPDGLRSHAYNADKELMDAVEAVPDPQNMTAYVYTTEARYVVGIRQLVNLPNLGRKKFACVMVPPILLLQKLEKAEVSSVKIDFGYSAAEWSVDGGDEVVKFLRLASILAVGKYKKVYIAQTEDSRAVSVSIRDEPYGIAFFDKERGEVTVEGLRHEHPGCRLEPNKTRKLVQSMLNSNFGGLMFNPASDSEFVLNREELEKLLIILDSRKQSKKFIDGLLGRR